MTDSSRTQSRVEAILSFWFGNPTDPGYGHYRKAWFIKDSAFDAQIRQQFLSDTDEAAAGVYNSWQAQSMSAIALLLLLDQFPRNLYRGHSRSFATDAQALAVAQHVVDAGLDRELMPAHRFFAYLPFEHSEDMRHQNRCVELMQRLVQDFPNLDKGLKGGLDYAIRHRDVIEQFGRFPHRNQVLSRQSTSEELIFLQQPGSSF